MLHWVACLVGQRHEGGGAGELGYLNLAVAQLFDVCSKINARISYTPA